MYDTVYTAQGNGRRDGRFYIPEALSTPLFVFPVRVEQCGVGLGLFVVTKATLLFSTPPPRFLLPFEHLKVSVKSILVIA
jgi:hypothetical protein